MQSIVQLFLSLLNWQLQSLVARASAEQKNKFVGLKMDPFGGFVFGVVFLDESKCRRFRVYFKSARRAKKWSRRFVFFGWIDAIWSLAKKEVSREEEKISKHACLRET